MTRTKRIELAAALAAAIALLVSLGIRELGESPAGEKRTAGHTDKGSSGQPTDPGVQPTDKAPTASGERQPSSTASRSGKVRSGSNGGKSLGAGSSAPVPGALVAFNQACSSADCDASASRTKIHRVRADGSGVQSLVQGIAPRWSRDGKSIASGTHYWSGGLQVMNADGSGVHDLGIGGSFPSWSPDGLHLAFNWPCQSGPTWVTAPANCWQYTEGPKAYGCGPSECGIGVVGADGRGPRRLGNGLWPDWGPDGRIVFTDGTPTEPCQYGTAYWYEGNPYTTNEESPYRLPSCALPLWVMNADGSGRTALPISKATAPKWSPDGKKIAYHVETEGVFISNADGSGILKVAPAGFMDPSWSPDGKTLALTRRTSDAYTWSIFVRAVDGSGEKQLTFGTRDTLPSFSPYR